MIENHHREPPTIYAFNVMNFEISGVIPFAHGTVFFLGYPVYEIY